MKNYKYELTKKDNEVCIFEFTDTYGSKSGIIWNMNRIEESLKEFERSYFPSRNKEERIKSLERTKKWLKENHPELMI